MLKYGCCFLLCILLTIGMGTAQAPANTSAKVPASTPEKWPHPFPARIQDGPNKDMFVMTLGKVETPLADGIFDPVKDEVTLNDGTVKKDHFRSTLGVKYYTPLDKSRFPLPPSGWCSWYY